MMKFASPGNDYGKALDVSFSAAKTNAVFPVKQNRALQDVRHAWQTVLSLNLPIGMKRDLLHSREFMQARSERVASQPAATLQGPGRSTRGISVSSDPHNFG